MPDLKTTKKFLVNNGKNANVKNCRVRFDSSIIFADSCFEYLQSTEKGAAIYVNSTGSSVTITRSLFYHCYSSDQYGAFYIFRANNLSFSSSSLYYATSTGCACCANCEEINIAFVSTYVAQNTYMSGKNNIKEFNSTKCYKNTYWEITLGGYYDGWVLHDCIFSNSTASFSFCTTGQGNEVQRVLGIDSSYKIALAEIYNKKISFNNINIIRCSGYLMSSLNGGKMNIKNSKIGNLRMNNYCITDNSVFKIDGDFIVNGIVPIDIESKRIMSLGRKKIRKITFSHILFLFDVWNYG